MSWGDEDTTFDVVINHEEQYSIWPSYKEVPAGWRTVGKQGKKPECLAYIDQVWTDMRPLSLRKALEEEEARRAKETS
ncbi:MAG TPA: MbtH family NRPS accessory protein [Polyangiaceae bacterium]|nr:MbtH family NRPS accessory protein [Polyangiaceae bacterium]